MTKSEIAAKADRLQNEINGISMPLSVSGGMTAFKQVRRILNDFAVLVRELAQS